jgi:outer membrane protein assembly factor BamB
MAGASHAASSTATHIQRPGGWAQFHGNSGHTGQMAGAGLGTASAAHLKQKWRFAKAGAVDSSPAIVDGVVYFESGVPDAGPVGGQSHCALAAVDAATGHLKWRFLTKQSCNPSSPAVSKGLVYAASWRKSACCDVPTSRLQALNARTGHLKWSTAAPGQLTRDPTVSGGAIYIGGYDGFNSSVKGNGGYVDAVDAATGRRLWTFNPKSLFGVVSDISVWNGEAFFADTRGHIYALSATTGHKLWVNRVAGVGCGDGCLYTNNSPTPAVTGGRIYVASNRGVDILSAATGAELWSAKASGEGSDCGASPAVGGGIVVALCDGNLAWAFQLSNHHLLWRTMVGPGIGQANPPADDSSPAISNHVVYLGTYLGVVYALNARSGRVLWRFQPRQTVESSAAPSGGTIFIGSEDGGLYAFGLHSGGPRPPKPGCTGSQTIVCTWLATGEHSFVVPNGVTGLHVVAVAGEGAPQWGVYGGMGARVAADLRVTAGQKLFIEVGGNGNLPKRGWNAGGSGGPGCFLDPDLGPSCGGGGGGATAVQTCSVGSPLSCRYTGSASTDPRLLVAAGGGGGGGLAFGCGSRCSNGGNAQGTTGRSGAMGPSARTIRGVAVAELPPTKLPERAAQEPWPTAPPGRVPSEAGEEETDPMSSTAAAAAAAVDFSGAVVGATVTRQIAAIRLAEEAPARAM